MVPFSLSKQALYVSTIFKPRPSCDMALLPQTRGDIELHSNSPASADEKWTLLSFNVNLMHRENPLPAFASIHLMNLLIQFLLFKLNTADNLLACLHK